MLLAGYIFRQVQGIDSKGYVIQRTTHTAISPQVPKPPKVFMPEVTRGYFDKTATLTCQVSSLVPYTVRWFKADELLADQIFP